MTFVSKQCSMHTFSFFSFLSTDSENFRQMNIVLDSELSSFTTVKGRYIIEDIIAGERNPEKLAGLANKGVKSSRETFEINRRTFHSVKSCFIFTLITSSSALAPLSINGF